MINKKTVKKLEKLAAKHFENLFIHNDGPICTMDALAYNVPFFDIIIDREGKVMELNLYRENLALMPIDDSIRNQYGKKAGEFIKTHCIPFCIKHGIKAKDCKGEFDE
jgi:hypothetical protein